MGISPDSSEKDVLEVFTNYKVSICVVENFHQFDKIYEVSTDMHTRKSGEREGGEEGEGPCFALPGPMQVWPQLPHLNAVVLWNGQFRYPLNRVYEVRRHSYQLHIHSDCIYMP